MDKPFALARNYEVYRNPDWSGARWRADEYPNENSFSQWWYMMITDAETKNTWSVGIGGFRGDDTSGAWVKVKKGANGEGDPKHYSVKPTLTVPFAYLEARENALDARVWRRKPGHDESPDAEPAVTIRALDDQRIEVKVDLSEEYEGGAGAHLVFTRDYGVLGYGAMNNTKEEAGKEHCHIVNIPFAYASRVEGRLWIGGEEVDVSSSEVSENGKRETGPAVGAFDHSPRFRAYVESTWGCTFPQPEREGLDLSLYPWKWLWGVVPTSAGGGAASTTEMPNRAGEVKGEVGFVVSNARIGQKVPLPNWFMEIISQPFGLPHPWLVDIEGTFAFIDLPDRRIAAVNVTAFEGSKPFASIPISELSKKAENGVNSILSRVRGEKAEPLVSLPLSQQNKTVHLGGQFSVLSAGPVEVETVRAVWMEHSNWQGYNDQFGHSTLPMDQTLKLITDKYAVAIVVKGNPNDFTRLPVKYTNKDGKKKIVSDFRSSFSNTYLRVLEKPVDAFGDDPNSVQKVEAFMASAKLSNQKGRPADAQLPTEYSHVLFEGFVPHNAAEFAYHAPFENEHLI